MRLAADCNYTKTCFPVAVIYFVDIGINPEGGGGFRQFLDTRMCIRDSK